MRNATVRCRRRESIDGAAGDGPARRQGHRRRLGFSRRSTRRLHLDTGASRYPYRSCQCLGIDGERIRVIAPDVGGGFGYKCVLQPEEICVAWLALTYKRPFRYVEDRREHLIAGANSRQHHYRLRGYADDRGRLLALDAEVTIDGGAYSNWPFTVALEPGQATGNLPGPYDINGYRCKTYCVATNKPGLPAVSRGGRTSVCFAIELLIDAIARRSGASHGKCAARIW